jgi:D-beta-D-heptose 7-phosphate kinase/D-beta-D-heptose 1-phosphate adenosyltransferase
MKEAKKPVVVVVSGGFDPLHIGHIRMFERAKALGDKLIVILNNDNWLAAKKQHIFMPDHQRKEVIEALRAVDEVVLTKHGANPTDMSVCVELAEIKPDIFANGGDRKPDGDPVPEVDLCNSLGVALVYNIGDGGKIQSSSWLLADYLKKVNGEKN